MNGLNTLFLRVAGVSAGCSAVLVPLLLLMPHMRRRIAAGSFYVLFLLLAVRLTVPVELPAVPAAVTAEVPVYQAVLPMSPPAENVPGTVHKIEAAPAVRRVPVTAAFARVWAAGVVVCGLWAAGSYALARRKLLRNSCPAGAEETALLERLRGELKVRRTVGLRRSGRAKSPLALGLLRPVIVLPERGAGELALRHELTHIRRWDVAYKLVLSLACAVHWFNPAVWWMNREAGRNLELCCDSEVVRGFSEEERRRYGGALLDAAESVRPVPFSTCFAGGKRQMKDRLQNLFADKKNSAALVCAVLLAGLVAGSLVACENAGERDRAARRMLFQDYFYENYAPDSCSVILADLTGDGLEEMLVLSIDAPSIREPLSAGDFTYGIISYYLIRDDKVVPFGGSTDVSSSHAGWGRVYLIPRTDGEGFALLDFRPYTAQGFANYSYGLYILDGDSSFLALEQGEASFQLDPYSLMEEDIGDNAAPEEVEALLSRVWDLSNKGVPLLDYLEDDAVGPPEFFYLNVSPEEVFSGAAVQDVSWYNMYTAGGNTAVMLPVPLPDPSGPEEALDRLEAALSPYEGGFVFRVPNYDGDWSIQIAGRVPMGEDGFMPVHYLEDEEWVPGRRYSFETTEAEHFDELFLQAAVTGPDGSSAERVMDLTGGAPGED